jgi:hypothetical protein
MTLVAVLLLVPTVTAATGTGNPCTASWSGPSAQHSYPCAGHVYAAWGRDLLLRYSAPLAAALLLLAVVPCVCVARYCFQECGGSRSRRPTALRRSDLEECLNGSGSDGGSDDDRGLGDDCDKASAEGEPDTLADWILVEADDVGAALTHHRHMAVYSRSSICMTKAATLLLAVLAVAFVAAAYYSGVIVFVGIKRFVHGILAMIRWILSITDDATRLLQVKGRLPDDFQAYVDTVLSIRGDLQQVVDDWSDGEQLNRFEYFVGFTSFPAMVPAGLCALCVLCAVFNFRRLLPMVVVLLCTLAAVPFGAGATVMFFAAEPFDVMCRERAAQLERRPGVFQWYVLPRCAEVNPVNRLLSELENKTRVYANKACESMHHICDADPAYEPRRAPLAIYHCARPPTDCSTLADVRNASNALTLKPVFPGGCPADNGGCTLTRCATDCENTEVRRAASTAVDAFDEVARIYRAVVKVLAPWRDCNVFFDEVLSYVHVCGHFSRGIRQLGVSCCLVVGAMYAAVLLMFLGSKRFRQPPHRAHAARLVAAAAAAPILADGSFGRDGGSNAEMRTPALPRRGGDGEWSSAEDEDD